MEEWRKCEGMEGRYEVSSLGNVRRLGFIDKKGKVRAPRDLKCTYSKSLKYKMLFTSIDGKNRAFYVHRLIALAFIPKPDGKFEVNHIDGNKANCVLENLEWVTSGDNARHAFKMGLKVCKITKGDGCPASKLNSEKVKEIRRLLSESRPIAHIAKAYGVVPSTIRWIRDGVTWSNVQ